MTPENFKRFDRIALGILSATALLGLAAFVPGGFLSGEILKGYLLVLGTSLSLALWLVGRLIEGSFHVPRSRIILALGIFAIVALVSAFFSHAPYLSFFGQGFEQGAAFSLVSLALMSFLASVLVSSKKRLTLFSAVFFLAYIALALFQLLHLFFPAATSLGISSDPTATVLGSWIDFAYLSGLALLGFVLVLSFFNPVKIPRMLAFGGSLLALFFIALVGSRAVYALTGIAVILTLSYAMMSGRLSEFRRFPSAAFLSALVLLFLFLTSNIFGGFLAHKLGATYAEVHPNLSATLTVARSSLAAHPLAGAGPNDFTAEWLRARPLGFNQSPYWDTPFTFGGSFVATTAFLGGGLGILGCLLLLAAFASLAVRCVFRVAPEKEGSTLVFSAFMMAAYLWIMLLVATPATGLVVLSFFFLGIFVAVLLLEKRAHLATYAFQRDYRRGFWSILSVVVFLMLALALAVFATKRFASEIAFASGSRAAARGDFVLADARFVSAIGLSDLPKYEEARTVLAEQHLQSMLSENRGSAEFSDGAKSAIQSVIVAGSAAAQRAVAIDPRNVQAYQALGDFMSMLAPLKIENAFVTAELAYKQAIALAPNYPKAYLGLGKLYFGEGDSANARIYAKKAVDLKVNYTQAYFLLAQIDAAAGDVASQEADFRSAVRFDTTDPSALLALGEFQYSQGEYSGAIASLQGALSISEKTIDAWYYLALAEAKSGQKGSAAKILTMLHAAYPDNADIESSLIGLSAQK